MIAMIWMRDREMEGLRDGETEGGKTGVRAQRVKRRTYRAKREALGAKNKEINIK